MKSILFSFALLLTFNYSNAQTASVDPAKLDNIKVSTDTKEEKTDLANSTNLVRYSLTQLNDSIAQNLIRSDVMRANFSEAMLTLEMVIDEKGTIHSYKISDDTAPLMSKLILEVVEKVNLIDVENLSIKGSTKLRIPVHYSL